MSSDNRLSEKQYLDAVADIAAVKNSGLDSLLNGIDVPKEAKGLKHVFKAMFKNTEIVQKRQEITNFLSLLTLKYDFKSSRLSQNELGQWEIEHNDWLKLDTLYEKGELQALLTRVKDDENLIDVYAKQDYIPVEFRRRAIDLNNAHIDYSLSDEPKKKFDHLPAVRNEDIVKNAKRNVMTQAKRYERSIAKQKINRNRQKHAQMMEKLKEQSKKQRARYHYEQEKRFPETDED